MWGRKQLEELIEDLTSEFIDQYEQSHERTEIINYGHYFMGSIVLTESNNEIAIIDGQQRLTSLTLLLIYFIMNYWMMMIKAFSKTLFIQAIWKKII